MSRCPLAFCILALTSLATGVEAAPGTGAASTSARALGAWVSAWGSSQDVPEALPPAGSSEVTLRQIVHLSSGGASLRLRVSNAFGRTPLHLRAVHVAHAVSPAASRIEPASDRAVLFDGRGEVRVPAGADYLSDPLDYPVTGLSDLAITLQIEAPPEGLTGHPGSRATSYLVQGSLVEAPELSGAVQIDHWYFLSGVDVSTPGGRAACIVVLGDSITDGRGSTTNGNDRWTDVLAARLQRAVATRGIAVVNAGIGGNRLLDDGGGPGALARFDRDVLARESVRALIVLEGINDLGYLTREGQASPAQHEALVQRMIGAYRQITLRAHAHGIPVIGATLLPFMGAQYFHPDASNERDRMAINDWIRGTGHFDAVIDFDRITADAAHPERLRAEYDSGDHLHPTPAGYRAMGEAVPLKLLAEPPRPGRGDALACAPAACL